MAWTAEGGRRNRVLPTNTYMKRIISFLLLLLALTGMVQAQNKDEKTVRRMIRDLEAAQVHKDLGAFDRIYADDLVFINHLGQRMNKKQRLEGLKTAPAMASFVFSREQLRITGNTAIANVEASMKPQGQDVQTHAVTIVFLKRKGLWQVVNIQATVVK